MANPYGDIELTPRGMRALAHPTRLAILSQLQRNGPSTATALAPLVGASPSVTSWHLRHLAEHGLVRDAEVAGDGRRRWWQAAARGFRFAGPDDTDVAGDDGDDGDDGAAASDAYRMLSRAAFDHADQLAGRWAREIEPALEDDWSTLAGVSNTRIVVTRDELAEIETAMSKAIEDVLTPYVLRKDEPAAPPGARSVRVLRYVLPGLDEDGGLW
jgi:DNA-binding transcriptional ArsR family regulator